MSQFEWFPSPNFNARPVGGRIWAVVWHATANGSVQGVIDWFSKPSAQVSAHYTIGKDGRTVQHVREADRAWHAGQSSWKQVNGCNDYSIGIELVNWNDGKDTYPWAQLDRAINLTAALVSKYGMKVHDVVGHYDVSPGRKTDPLGLDMDYARHQIYAKVRRL